MTANNTQKRRAIPQVKKRSITEEKLKAPMSFELLERILVYLLYYRPLDTAFVEQIGQLFDIISEDSLNLFEERKLRAEMIKRALKALREEGLTDPKLVVDYILASSDAPEYETVISELQQQFEDDQQGLFSEKNIEYISSRVSNVLQYGMLYSQKDSLNAILQRLNTGDVGDLKDVSHEFSEASQKIVSDMQRAESSSGQQRGYIFGSDSYKQSIKRTLDDLKKPSAFIKTGIREFDRFLGGGFRSEKHYVFLGAPGTGKSVLLLNIMTWAIKFNEHIAEDINSGLKPLVLFVTQENSISETDERMYSIVAPEDSNIRPFHELAPDELDEIYAAHGWGTSKIHYAIEYRGNKEISTGDYDALIDTYERKGYKVILAIHDYIKRIRPKVSANDIRLDLAEVVNDEVVIAKNRKIPFITVMQLNREAIGKIEEAKRLGKSLENSINASYIGESIGIYENTDFCAVLLPYEDPVTGKKYLCLSRIKSRYKIVYKGDFIGVPFMPESICMETNYGVTTSNVIETLGDNLKEYNPARTTGKQVPSGRSPVPKTRFQE